MGKRARQTIAREFSGKERAKIKARDRGGCIFCNIGYRMEKANWMETSIFSIMHYIPRSKNGLGIEQNGAIGCIYHHNMLDNGNKGLRGEMLQIFRDYLKSHYTDWNEEDLVYSKWKQGR